MQKRKNNYSYIGKSIERVDADLKLNGNALYGDDLSFKDMLYISCIRNPYPKSKIKNIDISEIKDDKDFVCLIKASDIPGVNKWPIVKDDYPFIADDIAEFHYQTIALLVARTNLKARELSRKVKIEYEKLDFIDDIFRAIEDEKNIFSKYNIKKGDALSEIKKCKYVVEGEFRTNYQVHCYLETQVATGVYNNDTITVYSSCQCPFYVLDAVKAITGFKSNKIKIIQTTTGGGFGGKEDVSSLIGAYVALASYITKKPVRLVFDREEDFRSMSKRHPSYSKVIYGADENGKIKACIVKYILDAGAYSTLSPIVLWRGTVHATGPYEIENVLIESYAVKTNKVPCGAFRGFGQPQISFAQESLIDDLAEKIGIDPLEFRLKNILKKGSLTATSQKVDSSLEDILKDIKKISSWDKRKNLKPTSKYKKRGLGLAISYYGVGLGAGGRYLDRAGAYVNIYKDSSVSVNVGNVEMGQGALTVLTQITSEMLNCPISSVKLEEVDTSKVSDSGPTVASRTTLMSGNAIIQATKPLRERIFKTAYEMLKNTGCNGEMIAKDGFFYMGKKKISFEEVIKQCWSKRLKMNEQGWYVSPDTSFKSDNGQGDAYIVYSYSANIVDLELDYETGEVEIKKVYGVYDIGKVINPILATGQAQGGILQGIGLGLFENLIIKDGVMKNPAFTDYIVPTSYDMPEYEIKFIENYYDKGPYKAKGLGELPLIAVSPAIRNAIKNAINLKLNKTPMLAEDIITKIKDDL